MKVKRYRYKGAAFVPILIAILVVGGLVAGGILLYRYFHNKGSGGPDDVPGLQPAETTIVTEILPETTPPIEIIQTIQITVSGNEYIYDNTKIELNELIDLLNSIDDKISVEIKDDNSSMKAYKALKEAFKDSGISYIEITE